MNFRLYQHKVAPNAHRFNHSCIKYWPIFKILLLYQYT